MKTHQLLNSAALVGSCPISSVYSDTACSYCPVLKCLFPSALHASEVKWPSGSSPLGGDADAAVAAVASTVAAVAAAGGAPGAAPTGGDGTTTTGGVGMGGTGGAT